MAQPTTTYGDTDVLRRRVDQLRTQADDLRGLADLLVARTDTTGWTGRAADSMRERVADRAGHLRDAAGDHEVAADALESHLLEVDRLTDAIAVRERRAASLLTDARGRVAAIERRNAEPDAVSVEPDSADLDLAGFDAPPSGSREWLTVELPGL